MRSFIPRVLFSNKFQTGGYDFFFIINIHFFFLSTFLCPAAVCERRSFFRPSIYLFLPSIPAKSKAGLICRKSHLNFWCVFHSFSRKSRRAERRKEHFDDYYKVSNKPSCSTAKVTKFYKVREAIFFFSILSFFLYFFLTFRSTLKNILKDVLENVKVIRIPKVKYFSWFWNNKNTFIYLFI